LCGIKARKHHLIIISISMSSFGFHYDSHVIWIPYFMAITFRHPYFFNFLSHSLSICIWTTKKNSIKFWFFWESRKNEETENFIRQHELLLSLLIHFNSCLLTMIEEWFSKIKNFFVLLAFMLIKGNEEKEWNLEGEISECHVTCMKYF